jgi:hypothetical protein
MPADAFARARAAGAAMSSSMAIDYALVRRQPTDGPA